jgi:hypothetical protein
MIVRKHPLVNLLELADQFFIENPGSKGRGRPYVYSEKTMFKCLLVKTVKRLHDCSGLYRYLLHQANRTILQAVGLNYPKLEFERLPHLKTLQRRFSECGPVAQRQISAFARELAARGVISLECLSVDGTICEALGPVWHQSDKRYAHVPVGLRNLDLNADWGKSGYRGWSYGYKALAFCNSGYGEPSVFVQAWVAPANISETQSLRHELEHSGIFAQTKFILADSGFDDHKLFELCRALSTTLVTPVSTTELSSLERCQRETMYLDYLDLRFYQRRSVTIEPLFGYVKGLFDLQELHQHGLYNAQAEILGAMAAYNLIVLLNVVEKLPVRAVKAFLDVI